MTVPIPTIRQIKNRASNTKHFPRKSRRRWRGVGGCLDLTAMRREAIEGSRTKRVSNLSGFSANTNSGYDALATTARYQRRHECHVLTISDRRIFGTDWPAVEDIRKWTERQKGRTLWLSRWVHFHQSGQLRSLSSCWLRKDADQQGLNINDNRSEPRWGRRKVISESITAQESLISNDSVLWSPSSKTTMSPGTRVAASTSSWFPSRMTFATTWGTEEEARSREKTREETSLDFHVHQGIDGFVRFVLLNEADNDVDHNDSK